MVFSNRSADSSPETQFFKGHNFYYLFFMISILSAVLRSSVISISSVSLLFKCSPFLLWKNIDLRINSFSLSGRPSRTLFFLISSIPAWAWSSAAYWFWASKYRIWKNLPTSWRSAAISFNFSGIFFSPGDCLILLMLLAHC